jgi:hypothetical protein
VALLGSRTHRLPKGSEHTPCAERAVKILPIEPRGTVTDDTGGERTVDPDWWI